jgi:hypothetical protein
MEKTKILRKRLLNKLVNDIHLTKEGTRKSNSKSPFIILFGSSREKEGKSQISRIIAQKMRTHGDSVVVFNPKRNDEKEAPLLIDEIDENNFYYEVPENYRDISIKDGKFLNSQPIEEVDYVFIELPPMSSNNLPLALIKISNLMLFIAKANRTWSLADRVALDDFQKINRTSIRLFLNGVSIYDLEPIIGEIPRKRGKFRKKIKELASFKFKRNKF